MNRYLKKGLTGVAVGITLNILGIYMKEQLIAHYSWAMIAGTLCFGAGFLYVFYSFVRKVEYKGVLEERVENAEIMERREAEKRESESQEYRNAS